MTGYIKEKNTKIDHSQVDISTCESDYISLIKSRLGLVMRHQEKELHHAIDVACKKFNCTPVAYLKMLNECSNDSPILEHLISAITIGETYFFRDKNQVQILMDDILPELIQRKKIENNLTLRIWSAGCSSGEEIYTIAMMLAEKIVDIDKWVLNLLATDINKPSLQKGLEGVYGQWSMRSIPPYFKDKYFTEENNKFYLNKRIKEMVTFKFLNLNEDDFPNMLNSTNAQDLIICRNVLIYFDSQHIQRLMKKISASLVPKGYLMLGASDPICLDQTNLVHHPKNRTLYILKQSVSDIKIEEILPINKNIEVNEVKSLKHTKQLKENTNYYLEKNIEKVSTLLNSADWSAALNKINDLELYIGKSVFFLEGKAIALANLGKLNESEAVCQACILLDPNNTKIHFTYALVLLELGKLEDSEMTLRKAIYLDKHFVNAHYQLGLFLLKQKHRAEGIKCLNNALKIANADKATYGRLALILENEIELYFEKEKSHE